MAVTHKTTSVDQRHSAFIIRCIYIDELFRRPTDQSAHSIHVADQTMSTVLKYPEDEETVRQAGLATVVGSLD